MLTIYSCIIPKFFIQNLHVSLITQSYNQGRGSRGVVRSFCFYFRRSLGAPPDEEEAGLGSLVTFDLEACPEILSSTPIPLSRDVDQSQGEKMFNTSVSLPQLTLEFLIHDCHPLLISLSLTPPPIHTQTLTGKEVCIYRSGCHCMFLTRVCNRLILILSLQIR